MKNIDRGGKLLKMRNKKLSKLQEIEDHYVSLDYIGARLRKVLTKDKEYQKLLKERKQKLTKQFKITSAEKKKYVLLTDTDFEILGKCKQLEKVKLNKDDKFLVEIIKTQLEADWRKYLLKTLNKLMKKYKK